MPRLDFRAALLPRAWRTLAFLLLALAAPSCGGADATGPSGGGGGGGGGSGGGGGTPVTPTPVVTSVGVAPTPVALTVGGTQQLTATPRDASGNAITGRTVTWTTSNAAAATVAGGLVSAVGAGSATITATCDGIAGTVSVTVTAPPSGAPVNRVILTPDILQLVVGGTGKITAATYDVAGAALTGRTVTWSSSNPAIATVATDGTVKAVAGGSAIVTATSEGKTATAQVTVNTSDISVFRDMQGNNTVTLELEQAEGKYFEMLVLDGGGRPVANPQVVATSSDSSVATISSTNIANSAPGFTISAKMKMGRATITLTCGGITYTANVTVISRVDSVFVSPASVTVPQGETRQLTVTLKDLAGNIVTGREIKYVSMNGTVASVNGTGVVTGQMPGTTTIEVSRSGRLVTVPVTVVPPTPVATVSLTPNSVVLNPGGSQQLTVVTKDAAGVVLTGRTVTYASSAPTVATVSSTGRVTAVALGAATITATSEGRTATAGVTVVPPIATITIEPATAIMHAGELIPLTVTTKDAAGNIVTGRQVSVTSNGPQVVRIDTTSGYTATALGLGTVTVTASAEGKSASMTIKVLPPPTVMSVTISPSSVQLYAGTTKSVTITPFDSAGNPLDGRTTTVTSANTAMLTVAKSTYGATLTGVATGTTSITATVEGKSATIPVIVDPAQVVGTVRLSPTSVALTIGETDGLSVTQLDTRGVPMSPPHTVTWSSSNPGVVSVSGGSIYAVAAGTATITATVDGKSGSATVTVAASPPVSGGGGGGGAGGGTVCAFLYTIPGLAPGQSTVKGTPSFPGGIDIVVTAGTTNTGTSSAPRYAYTVTVYNRYTQSITATYGMSASSSVAGSDRRTVGAGQQMSFSFSGLPPNTTLYLLIEKVTFGTSTTNYCK